MPPREASQALTLARICKISRPNPALNLAKSDSTIDSLAVLPFTNVSGDATSDYLSDGITESLIASLTHVPELKVKSRNSVSATKGKTWTRKWSAMIWACRPW